MGSVSGYMRKLPWRAILLPGLVLAIVLWAHRFEPAVERLLANSSSVLLHDASSYPHVVFQMLLWLVGAWLLNGFVIFFVWEGVSRHFFQVPRFFRHTVAAVLFLLACAGIARTVFHESLTGLWATSGVLGLVLGFALKSLIADFFSGLAMSLDPPFYLGDWIMFRLPGEETTYGKVAEMHWRLTRVEGRGGRNITIPHSMLTSVSVVRLHHPEGSARYEVAMTLNQTIGVERGLRILESAVYGLPGILENPKPEVLVHDTDQAGIIYVVRYWIEPGASRGITRHTVMKSLLLHMEMAGIGFANVKRDVYSATLVPETWDPDGERVKLLAKCGLFASLPQPDLEELSRNARILNVKSGQTVVRAGEPGESMFFIAEGLLEVLVQTEAATPVRVAHLRAGDFFGEMSLLTGDPRMATVVAVSDVVLYEVDKAALEPILVRRPELAEETCRVVATRRLETQGALDSHVAKEREDGSWLGAQLLDRMKRFFGLDRVARMR